MRWTDEIAEITTAPEFQNATIEIYDGATETVYDFETDTWTVDEPGGLVYAGRARVKDIRWGVFSGGESQANAKTVTAIRVQVGKNAVGRVPPGTTVLVTGSDDGLDVIGRLYKVNSDSQGSAQASRTFEAALDGDSEDDF